MEYGEGKYIVAFGDCGGHAVCNRVFKVHKDIEPFGGTRVETGNFFNSQWISAFIILHKAG